jgi:threonine dehydrogenase-like Zn-dependent dehydrogenase
MIRAAGMLGPPGRLVQIGVTHEDVRIHVSSYAVFAKELSISGSNSLANAYPAARTWSTSRMHYGPSSRIDCR